MPMYTLTIIYDYKYAMFITFMIYILSIFVCLVEYKCDKQ